MERELEAEHGPGVVPLPSRTAFYRLLKGVSAGRHTLGSARTRRSLAKQPQGMFGQLTAARPGEVMEIDSTPLDVLVVHDDGTVDSVELTGIVDVATRTLAAAVLRQSTKAVDAALLLARAMTPEPTTSASTTAANPPATAVPRPCPTRGERVPPGSDPSSAIPLPPFPGECESSHWSRPALANHVPLARLRAPSRWLESRLTSVDVLCILSGQTRQHLVRTLPGLQTGARRADRPAIPDDHVLRWACRRCVVARTGAAHREAPHLPRPTQL